MVDIADVRQNQAQLQQVAATILLWQKLTPPRNMWRHDASIQLQTHWLEINGRAESGTP